MRPRFRALRHVLLSAAAAATLCLSSCDDAAPTALVSQVAPGAGGESGSAGAGGRQSDAGSGGVAGWGGAAEAIGGAGLAGGGACTTIAANLNLPVSVAIDDSHVFWVEHEQVAIGASFQSAILAAPKGVCAAAATTVVGPTASAGRIWRMVVGQGIVAFVSDEGVLSASTAGGPPVLLLNPKVVGDIAIHGGDLLVTFGASPGGDAASTQFSIARVPLGGGPVVTLAALPELGGGNLAVDDERVYATTASSVWSVSLSGGSPEPLAQGEANPYALLVSGTRLYWSDLGDGGTDGSNGNGQLRYAPVDGSAAATTLAVGLGYAVSLAAAGSHLYWTIEPSASGEMLRPLFRVSAAGGLPEAMAVEAGSSVYNVNPRQLVGDADAVYFVVGHGYLTHGTGSVGRLPIAD